MDLEILQGRLEKISTIIPGLTHLVFSISKFPTIKDPALRWPSMTGIILELGRYRAGATSTTITARCRLSLRSLGLPEKQPGVRRTRTATVDISTGIFTSAA